MSGKVLLSFDVEEFDLPREHGAEISLEEGIKVSKKGLRRVLEVLKKNGVRATFFCTGNFAKAEPELLRQILENGHEIACHGVDHFEPKRTDICESKRIVERVIGNKVVGYRQPRMQKIDYKELERCGYRYDSSINPAFIPGRYNNVKVSRRPFKRNGIVEIPTSVATPLRIPLFWLALHLFPVWLYLGLVKKSLKKTGFFATYFHPWEFADISGFRVVPGYIRRSSGDRMIKRLDVVIRKLKRHGDVFCTYGDYVELDNF